MKPQNKARVKRLRDLIAHHQTLYYEKDAPEISDEAYDSLLRELRELSGAGDETKDKLLNPVGAPPSEAFAKVKHQVRQWSLDNVFSTDELHDWEERIKRYLREQDVNADKIAYEVGHKLDGLKIVLEYQNGKFVRAATRGDGVIGEDVTHTALTISDIPNQLKLPLTLTCVGEVWLSETEFLRINKEREKNGEPLFQNPRNSAAGSLRQLDPEVTRSRNLSVIVYDLDALEEKNTKIETPTTQQAELALLKRLGFVVSKDDKICSSIDEIIKYYNSWKNKHEKLPYGVDGIVVKVDQIRLQRLLGFTAKAPRFAVAYKFPAEQTTTVVEAIHLQVGRTGIITPVAHLTPTLIAGSTVSRATLHNEDQIKRLDVRVGDTVILQKAGDVIPEIVAVVMPLRPEDTKPYRFPKKVKGCGGDGSIERIPGEAAYRCKILESDLLKRRRLYYFVGKSALNIDGVGPRLIDLLLDKGLIDDADDLFTLEVGDFEGLPGFKRKAAENAVNAISKAKEVPLHRLLVGLSIEHVGEETARLIAEYCGQVAKVRSANESALAGIHGVGDVVARSLVSWMNEPKNRARLDALLPHLKIVNPPKTRRNTILSGKTVVFTGSLERLTRDEAKNMARKAGAQVTSSVSKKTDYVVEGKEAGSKAAEARQLGVAVISEAEFLKMIG